MAERNGGPPPAGVHPLFGAAGAADATEAAVRIGYGDLFGLPMWLEWFRVRMDIPTAVRIIPLVSAYNEFVGQDVADALEQLEAVGLARHYVEFGREGSPVLYVTHMMNTEDLSAHPLAGVAERFRALGADEIDPYGPYIIRVWWD